MDSEQILIEFLEHGDRAQGGSLKPVSATKIKDSIQKLTSLVQQLANDNALTNANGLVLDEVEIAIKLTDAGDAVLLGDGQSNGAFTLRFRRPMGGTTAVAASQPISTSSPPKAPEISLISPKGVDYSKLQSLLTSAKWQEANQETWNVICQAANKKTGSVLTVEEIKQIDCAELQIIDELWRKYSQGRYGFSAQNQIYMSSILE